MGRDVEPKPKARRLIQPSPDAGLEDPREATVRVAHDLIAVFSALRFRLEVLAETTDPAERRRHEQAMLMIVDETARKMAELHDRMSRKPAPSTPPGHAARPVEGEIRRILVIDDDHSLREIMKEALAPREVLTAADGAEALARLGEGAPIDLVLCDLTMEPMDGWSFARRARRLRPDLPIYLLTGWGRQIDPGDKRRKLVSGVLSKPISLQTLRQLVEGES